MATGTVMSEMYGWKYLPKGNGAKQIIEIKEWTDLLLTEEQNMLEISPVICNAIWVVTPIRNVQDYFLEQKPQPPLILLWEVYQIQEYIS